MQTNTNINKKILNKILLNLVKCKDEYMMIIYYCNCIHNMNIDFIVNIFEKIKIDKKNKTLDENFYKNVFQKFKIDDILNSTLKKIFNKINDILKKLEKINYICSENLYDFEELIEKDILLDKNFNNIKHEYNKLLTKIKNKQQLLNELENIIASLLKLKLSNKLIFDDDFMFKYINLYFDFYNKLLYALTE